MKPTEDDLRRDLAADLAAFLAAAKNPITPAQKLYELAADGWPAAVRRAIAAEAEVERLLAAIRRHRDERGDDRCFQDDATLYAVLPEGDTRPARETAVTLENCAKYIECRQKGQEYVSPQRRIEELEVEVVRLRALLEERDNG